MARMNIPTRRTPTEALAAVIAIAFGGVAARMADHFGVSNQTVSFWRAGKRDERTVLFPAEFCPECERLTREKGETVLCDELRPDIDWGTLKDRTAEEWKRAAMKLAAQPEPNGA